MIYRYNEVVSSVCGSPVKSLFVPFVNKGHLDIKVSGDFNLQEQIEAESCLCDINYLVERFNLGDVDALNKRQSFFLLILLLTLVVIVKLLTSLKKVVLFMIPFLSKKRNAMAVLRIL